MALDPRLAPIFVGHLPRGVSVRDEACLEGELACFWGAASTAWPTLALDPRIFIQHVAERSLAGELPSRTYAADLYLAASCMHSVVGAHEAFDQRYAAGIEGAVARRHRSPTFVDELKQRLRELLFVSARGLPKIAEYRGRAALGTWVTITARRVSLNLLRGEARRRETTHEEDGLAVDDSPELALLKRRYAPHFATALANAFARLSDETRTMLQLNVVDRLSIDALGALYKVGRSTAARWIASARLELAEVTRRELKLELGLSDSEYDSLAALIRSQLEVSVVRLLRCG